MRFRDLNLTLGEFPTGPNNAITDVPGVLVGHQTIIRDEPRVARTGVTMVVPNDGRIWHDYAFAGYHALNGNGEMTGLPWLIESGMLGSPIGLTNTHQVGIVRDALVRYGETLDLPDPFLLPVVAETYDGWLNDVAAFHVTTEDALAALANAGSGSVAEGNVGGGTGMICHGFKGGIGTSSRVVAVEAGTSYTVGVLVQANYGARRHLRVDGVPVGRFIPPEHTPTPWETPPAGSSIIAIIGTDAPLLPVQCTRLAQRATIGLARVGGTGHNDSGDIFLAFATGNHLPAESAVVRPLQMLRHRALNPLFDATAEAVEEAILNALCAAETMTGYRGRVAHALPLTRLAKVMEQPSFGWIGGKNR